MCPTASPSSSSLPSVLRVRHATAVIDMLEILHGGEGGDGARAGFRPRRLHTGAPAVDDLVRGVAASTGTGAGLGVDNVSNDEGGVSVKKQTRKVAHGIRNGRRGCCATRNWCRTSQLWFVQARTRRTLRVTRLKNVVGPSQCGRRVWRKGSNCRVSYLTCAAAEGRRGRRAVFVVAWGGKERRAYRRGRYERDRVAEDNVSIDATRTKQDNREGEEKGRMRKGSGGETYHILLAKRRICTCCDGSGRSDRIAVGAFPPVRLRMTLLDGLDFKGWVLEAQIVGLGPRDAAARR
ncbi:hypothetical protein K438DRAFT_1939933 [Mycena galopus ATCC 62051]|nr:hypothetical protein K438DRAFT_1939933 [Mycena galopus ATCC 62051]